MWDISINMVKTYLDVFFPDVCAIGRIRPIHVHVPDGLKYPLWVQSVVVLVHIFPNLHVHKILSYVIHRSMALVVI